MKPAMTPMYAIRKGKIIRVLHLRKKHYILASLEDTIVVRDGKRYAADEKDELLISDSKIFETHSEAREVLGERGKSRAKKLQREKEEWENYMKERDALVDELLRLANEKEIDMPGIGFCTNEEIKDAIWRLKNQHSNE